MYIKKMNTTPSSNSSSGSSNVGAGFVKFSSSSLRSTMLVAVFVMCREPTISHTELSFLFCESLQWATTLYGRLGNHTFAMFTTKLFHHSPVNRSRKCWKQSLLRSLRPSDFNPRYFACHLCVVCLIYF